MSIAYDDVVNAQKAQGDVIRKTSLTFSDTFTEITGSTVYLKMNLNKKLVHSNYAEHIIKLKHYQLKKEKKALLLLLLVIMHKELHMHQH